MIKYYQPGQRIDHYIIQEQLGSGAASRVYRACDVSTGQQVVLKFPLDELVGGAVIYQRYLNEREVGRRLNHPHIQRHLNQDEQRREDYLVLEYLEGRTLRALMYDEGMEGVEDIHLMPVERVLQLLIPVCDALTYAHTQGVVHRDMKPENILVLETGDVKIIDFGIALLETKKSRQAGLHIAPSPVGTPNYMAPELLWGQRGDVRSDIYAMGVILYELLCGQTPFPRKTDFSLVTQHISHDPPSLLEVNPALPSSLATVVMRAIRREPERRYAQMRDMLHDLTHLNEVVSVKYSPDPPKVGGRYRQAIALGLVIIMICLGLVSFGFFAQFIHHGVH